jgi:hypothetical protein
VEQGRLFDTTVVKLTDFREARPARTRRGGSTLAPATPRPLAMRSEAHLARMLAHLTAVNLAARRRR